MSDTPRLNVVLVAPEIPPNTGNIARLTAATGCRLHLVEPLGFSLEDRYVRRAGLDYWPHVDLRVHPSWEALVAAERPERDRTWLFSTKGSRSHWEADYRPGDFLVFGREADGLPERLLGELEDRIVTIPHDRRRVRSLNLANSVAVAVYEALRPHRTPAAPAE